MQNIVCAPPETFKLTRVIKLLYNGKKYKWVPGDAPVHDEYTVRSTVEPCVFKHQRSFYDKRRQGEWSHEYEFTVNNDTYYRLTFSDAELDHLKGLDAIEEVNK